MWRMISGHSVDGSVGQRLAYGLNMLVWPQRGIHLVGRVIAGHLAGRQHEVMGCNLRGHIDAALFGPPDDIDGLGARDMADVQPGAGEFSDLHVSRDHACLGSGGPSRKSELSGYVALVTAGARAGKLRILGVLSDDPTEGSDILQRASH